MSTCSNHTTANTKQIEKLLWPPKHMLPPNVTETDRIDLLAYLDAEVYNTRGSYPLKLPYGVTVLRDRVVLEQERFSSPSRDHQTALASQFQASFAEQGFAVVVKEWANPTQKRSILRVRLKCRFAGCKFHFQINWDQNMGYWFISRRRCGIFQHSCRTQEGGNATTESIARHSLNHKRPVADSPPPMYAAPPASNKRARIEKPQADQHASGEQPFLVTPHVNGTQAHSLRTVSHGENSPGAPTPKPAGKGENAAMDFAESLLSLSKGKQTGSQAEDDSSTEGTKQPKREPSPKVKTEERPPRGEQPQQHHYPIAAPSAHPNVRTRPLVLGEIPHGTQAFAQMANTMGHNLYNHLVHGRGEMSLTMSFDGEGFVLRTSVPSGPPPSLSHVPPQPHLQPPLQAHHHSHDPKSAPRGSGPLNYPYLPPQRYQAPARNDPAVVML